MKKTKRAIAFLMCLTMLFCSLAAGASATATPREEWDSYWANDAEISAGEIMSPGSNESERNFSWYSAADEGKSFVKISESPKLTDAEIFEGTSIKTPEGDRSNKVTVNGLLPGKTYYYSCCTDKSETSVRSFKTLSGKSFSALYLTDIHISDEVDENDTKVMPEHAYKLERTIGAALEKNSNISLLLSAGDQASSGLRSEYVGFASPRTLPGLSVAMLIGNHDRKGVAYKYFTNNPNEDKSAFVKSYVGSDYWFVKGDALFLMMDGNNGSGCDHYDFVRDAVKENPDVKWRVMMLHHDLYGGRKPSREQENSFLRLIWTPIADEFGIDLVMMGHSHYYTVSDVIYDDKSVEKTSQNCTLTNPEGTVYFVSGSVNRPTQYADDVPLGDKIGYAYLPEETRTIYNTLDFTEESITVTSYTLEENEAFNSFEITKTSRNGGHPDKLGDWYDGIVRLIGTVYTVFNNIGVYSDLKEKGFSLPLWDAVFGK